ncbi:Uncharacterized protein BP5553_05524 [Venustampulla echinocandica]|uniref:Uncharacterized protein n=1 Tax=Venustampulla echinocandica TaxID=2656787 RepID=A0A370TRE7_9HELO|nr:Uncharacterized protein BP5553_05524 [Venustampulla echinocandica]RDL38091.1 Uncharacterized protein BP5553_05524 [Venustampulla echinocandica]
MSYRITEPHPTVSKYTYSGRGGAGNTFKAPKTTKGSIAQGPASHFEHGLPSTSSKFISGRGGAGNVHDGSERPVFSFDEELERQNTRENTPGAYHVGRGGAGNRTSTIPNPSRKSSSDSASSTNSAASSRSSGFLHRLSQTFDRR